MQSLPFKILYLYTVLYSVYVDLRCVKYAHVWEYKYDQMSENVVCLLWEKVKIAQFSGNLLDGIGRVPYLASVDDSFRDAGGKFNGTFLNFGFGLRLSALLWNVT